MNRLRRDLILQRTLLWVPTGFVIAIILLFLFKLPLSAPESILTLVFTFFIGLGFGRMSGNQRFNQIKDALIAGLSVTPLLEQEGKGITAKFLGMQQILPRIKISLKTLSGNFQKVSWVFGQGTLLENKNRVLIES